MLPVALDARLDQLVAVARHRHPVRRFINRLASLGSGFEDFSEAGAQEFLIKVKALVQEAIADARLTYRLIPYPSPEFQNTMVTWAKQLDFPLEQFRKVAAKE